VTAAVTLAPPPVVAVAEPLATAADIRAAIDVLASEADAHEALAGFNTAGYHATEAAQMRRVIALLRACLHYVEAGR